MEGTRQNPIDVEEITSEDSASTVPLVESVDVSFSDDDDGEFEPGEDSIDIDVGEDEADWSFYISDDE